MATKTIIIGAGIGGLTTAALLLKAGHRVTVLEAHVYPGGCAGTFYHKGYRFDAGATLAGGFAPGGPHYQLAQMLGLTWPISPADPAWVVHLPNGRSVTQWADPDQWRAERQAAFPHSEPFWQTQELLAQLAWDIASRPFPWPPRSMADGLTLLRAIRPSTLRAIPYLFSSISRLIPTADPMFRTFLDAQLLISVQTTAAHAGALYGSTALDLPRRGVNHITGGIGMLAHTLVDWIRAHGGEVHFRQQVERIGVEGGRAKTVTTNKGLHLSADNIVANVTPWALAQLLGAETPPSLRREVRQRGPTWGAFTLYLGLDGAELPPLPASHHQIIRDHTRPLGEANSVFVSLSKEGDDSRAPAGHRTATLSTHTDVDSWWRLRYTNQAAYHARRDRYVERMLSVAETAVPGLRQAIRLCLPGTPVTFQFYTRRPQGMVGGFPQTSLFNVRGPATGLPNLWLVGDSIFPGQSTAGVTLGGMRVAAEVVNAATRLQ